jgi:hypothetical protein
MIWHKFLIETVSVCGNVSHWAKKNEYVKVNLKKDIRISRHRDRSQPCLSSDSLRHSYWDVHSVQLRRWTWRCLQLSEKNLVLSLYHLLRVSHSIYNKVRTDVRGSRQCSWMRHYATSRKVAGFIPDDVTGFFNWPNNSSQIMALG